MDTFRMTVAETSTQTVHVTSEENMRRVACAVIHLPVSTDALLNKVRSPLLLSLPVYSLTSSSSVLRSTWVR